MDFFESIFLQKRILSLTRHDGDALASLSYKYRPKVFVWKSRTLNRLIPWSSFEIYCPKTYFFPNQLLSWKVLFYTLTQKLQIQPSQDQLNQKSGAGGLESIPNKHVKLFLTLFNKTDIIAWTSKYQRSNRVKAMKIEGSFTNLF